MTTKEKLANEYVELKKQFDGDDFKADIRQHQVWWLTKEFKVIELKEKIGAVRRAIREKEAIKQREDYYETEEGKAVKKALEEKRDKIFKEELDLYHAMKKYVSRRVKQLLGEQWDVTSFSSSSMKIGIVEKYNEDGSIESELFGHSFDVYFGMEFFKKDVFEWRMNYGTMGAFNIDAENTRTQFIIGMGKFASDTTIIPQLKEKLQRMSGEFSILSKELSKTEEELRNPKALAEK